MGACGWIEEFAGAITVCDRQGTILSMNRRAVATFREQGGEALIGTNLLDCHPEPSRSKLRDLLERPQPNIYTIEKQGRRKLVYQTPWCEAGAVAGLVEVVLELPAEMPHFVRQG
jgi:transcriptional regulator with PAS, ATPase and Fis domain